MKSNEYENKIEELEETFKEKLDRDSGSIRLDNQKIKDCVKSQMSLQLEWGQLQSDVSSIVRELDQILEYVFARIFDEKVNNRHKNVTTQEAKNAALSHEDYVNYKIVYNRALKLKTQVDSVVDTIRSRNYSVNKLCDLIVQGSEDHIV